MQHYGQHPHSTRAVAVGHPMGAYSMPDPSGPARESIMRAELSNAPTEDLRAELSRLNDLRADDTRRTAICQELTLRLIAKELPADWSIWHDERYGWAVSRDHGSVVVGVGYRTLAQAFDVARRTLAEG